MSTPDPQPPSPQPPHRVLVERHAAAVRVTHWINALSLFLLLFSGLQIFNAHPALYWGAASHFADPWLSMTRQGSEGITQVGGAEFVTTGFLGSSGAGEARGFPAWLTLPSANHYLAPARRWHFFFAWLFVLNGLVYLVSGLVSGHLKRDLAPTRGDLRHIGADILDHLRLRFPKGEEARRYNVLQKLAYVGMIVFVLPLIVLTGMTMSPGLNAAFPFLLDLFGGRQSARSLHFIAMGLIVLFILVHVGMVLLTGPLNQLRGMITGKYAIEAEPDDKESRP